MVAAVKGSGAAMPAPPKPPPNKPVTISQHAQTEAAPKAEAGADFAGPAAAAAPVTASTEL
jgi:hypothetical protein